jgi:hypothetical protein
MLAERVKDWTQGWKEEGIQEGLRRGRQEGEALLLKRQLRRRFGELPPHVERRLATALPEQLEAWADRILDAATLTRFFGTDRCVVPGRPVCESGNVTSPGEPWPRGWYLNLEPHGTE